MSILGSGPIDVKDVYADTKAELKKKTQRVPLHLNCPAGAAHEAQAMREGFIKYGYGSFLNDDVKMSAVECLGAAKRHIERLLSGEDYAPDEYGAHHAGHARAMLGIYLECMEAGKLVDDRHATQRASTAGDPKNRSYVGRMYDRMFGENAARDQKLPSR